MPQWIPARRLILPATSRIPASVIDGTASGRMQMGSHGKGKMDSQNKGRVRGSAAWGAAALCLALVLGPGRQEASAQAPLKLNVMLYNKLCTHADSRATLESLMKRTSVRRGFNLTIEAVEDNMTLSNLKTFDVVVWTANEQGFLPPDGLEVLIRNG